MDYHDSTPQRCIQEWLISPELSQVCGSLADVLTEEGPKCQSCFAEFGGAFVTSLYRLGPVSEHPEFYRTSALWRKANIQAARELDQRGGAR